MKISHKQLRKLIHESIKEILAEDDIDYDLWKAPDIQEFWDELKASQKQTVMAILRPGNNDVLQYIKKEHDLLSTPLGELSDEDWQLAKLKDDPRIKMIANSEDQTLLNVLRDPDAVESLRALIQRTQPERDQRRARKLAGDLTPKPNINETRKKIS